MNSTRRMAAALVLAPGLWGATVAQAEDKPTLGVVAVSLPYKQSSTVATLQAVATQAVLRAERFDGQDLVDRVDVQASAARRDSRRKAVTRFQSAREAYDGLDLDRAAQLFAEAADLFRDADLRAAFDDYVNARLWHAASRYLNGDKPGAQKEFTKIFVLSPRVVLDRQAFPPDLLAAAERARAGVTADTSFSLTVTATPPGLAWVDGRLAGPTPATVSHLAAGEHDVIVAAPGFQQAVTNSASAQQKVVLSRSSGRDDFETVRAQVAAGFFAVDRTAKLAAVARSLGVEQVLVVALEEGKPGQVHLLRVTADGHPLAGAEGNAGIDGVEELSRLLPAMLGKDAPEAAQKALLLSERRSGQSSSGVNVPGLAPWFAIGAGALAGGSLLFALLANGELNNYKTTPQNSPQAPGYKSATQTDALVADVFGVTAGVVAATAASFYFTPGLWGWHPRGSGDAGKPDSKPRKDDHNGEDDLRESLQISPVVGPNGGEILVSARF